MMNDDRAEILRILYEQKIPAVATAQPYATAQPFGVAEPPAAAKPHTENTVEKFMSAARRNSAEVQLIESEAAAPAAVAQFLTAQKIPSQIVCEERLLSLPWNAAGITARARAPTSDDPCGATFVLAAAADTGAMLLTDSQKHALTHSLLPPCHIAIVRAADIVPSMAALWQQLPSPLPRGCCLICGPSRTADIEQTLILGVHGPVTVFILVVR